METKPATGNAISRRKFIEKTAVLSTFMIVPRFVLGGKGYTAPSDLITLGFIGAGKQATGLKQYFLDTHEAKIVAVADVFGAKMQRLAGEVNQYYATQAGQSSYDGCKTYPDFRDILARKDVDAVVIATPDHWHSNHAVLAAKAG